MTVSMATSAAGSRPASNVKPSRNKNVVANLEGALLISRDLFPYFLLVALEAGGPLRSLLLLLAAPAVRLLELVGREGAALRVMIFVATAGVRVVDVKAVAKATLPKFFLEDLRDGAAYRAFAGCGGRRCAVTACPRVMVEQFLREFLDVDCVVGTELRSFKGFFLGVPAPGSLMTGARAVEAAATADIHVVQVGIGRKDRYQPFMAMCARPYWIEPDEGQAQSVPRCEYPKPLIFHDGRLVGRPTPLAFLTVVLWLPLGVLLVALRIIVGFFPDILKPISAAAAGVRIRSQTGTGEAEPGRHAPGAAAAGSVMCVCNHRTLLDPVFLAVAFRRKVTAVTFSLSRVSEMISPIPTVRLTRDRCKDSEIMQSVLERGDVVVCPEGTTCREPYLLRFSPLFAELTESVWPVAITNEGSMFYGNTVRGDKCWDFFFFLMNPRPFYNLQLLGKVSSAGRSKYDVANDVQRAISRVTGFECTNFSRKDKYRMIAGHDGCEN